MKDRKNEEYVKTFDDWINKGNRLLKIGDTVLLIMRTIRLQHGDIYLVYACDNVHTYSGWMAKSVFGKMISEKATGILIDKGMEHISLYNFADKLIYHNSRYGIGFTILFSFDRIDTEQLPGWIVEELMIQKLSK